MTATLASRSALHAGSSVIAGFSRAIRRSIASVRGSRPMTIGLTGLVDSPDHRQVEVLFLRALDGVFIARVRMPHDAGGRIVPQDTGQPQVGSRGAVANDHHAGVL